MTARSGSSGDSLELLVGFGEPTLDNEQVCELGDRDVADRLWCALGFPDVPEGELAFTDEDARALRLATEGFAQLTSDQREEAFDLMLHEARIISASLANWRRSSLTRSARSSSWGCDGSC